MIIGGVDTHAAATTAVIDQQGRLLAAKSSLLNKKGQ
jgi:hypothetical protein